MRAWQEQFTPEGLVIIGVHSPEFFWEKPLARLQAVVKELRITYPVVQDNDFAIWNRYGIRYWPTTVLVDRRGIARYYHIGEGALQELDAMIRRLLEEAE